MTLYSVLRIVKFIGIMVYAGGLVGAFFTQSDAEQKRLVHFVSSPGIVAVWGAGYGLALYTNVSLLELWIIAALMLSVGSQLALVYAAARGRRGLGAFLMCVVPVLAVVVLMVLRPVWSSFGS